MVAWATEAYGKNMQELHDHQSKAPLRDLLYRHIVETGKQGEFLEWLARDMGLDEPMDLTRVDALLAAASHS